MQSAEPVSPARKPGGGSLPHVMYTRCPYCHTYFKIQTEHIKRAEGKVRCGRCFKVFNSIGNLLEQLPVSLESRKPYKEPPSKPPSIPNPAAAHPAAAPPAPPAPVQKYTKAATPEDNNPVSATASDRIDGILVDATESRELILHPALSESHLLDNNLPRIAWASGLIMLLMLFVFQYSYFKRDQLIKNESLQPWVQTVCNITHCRMPLQSDVSKIELSHRDISSHPKVKDALLITVVIVNNASFPQPFPAMEIRLSDINGQMVARRIFYPDEYLDADVDLRNGLSAQSPVQLALEIADPGKTAVNFEFSFLANE